MKDYLLDGVAKFVLGLETPEVMASVAADALAGGIDSVSLRDIAALEEPRAEEVLRLLERAMREMGLCLPTRRDAAGRLARGAARKILDGELSPYDGSRQIWALARCVREPTTELDPFIYAASEWEERPDDRLLLEDGMRDAARALLRRRIED